MSEQQPVGKYYSDDRTRDLVGSTIHEYNDYFRGANAEDQGARKSGYATMINDFYNVVTDFYEFGWGGSFHFAPRFEGETFRESIVRAEHFLALHLGLRPGMKVLDVGCGIGGPARTIARFSGAEVVGLNNNEYQLTKMAAYNRAARLEQQCSGVRGDFMRLELEEASFDSAYEIEATCHAPDKAQAFSEILRVLKPGGLFAGYEWCLTDHFDSANERHRRLKHEIEAGNSLPDIASIPDVAAALQKAGFEVVTIADMAMASDARTPWHLPLRGERYSLTALRRSRIGRYLSNRAVAALEWLGIAPKGATEVSDMLNGAADALVEAGQLGIFTPDLFFVARRPA